MPVRSFLTVTLEITGKNYMTIINIFCELTNVIPQLHYLVRMVKDCSLAIKQVNLATSDIINMFQFQCSLLPSSVSTQSWSHVPMDGEELDDK
jgi:hypothetical protein